VCHPWVTLGYDGPVNKDIVCDVSEILMIVILYVFFACLHY
jgi:hypothetical protein